jgi:acyl-CoA hydrolase
MKAHKVNNLKLVVNNDIPDGIPDYLSSTKLVMPENLNPAGNLFGGQMMAWMDKVSAMLAYRIAKGNVVTASVSEINFLAPVQNGDQVELVALLTRLGNTSATIRVVAKVIKLDGVENDVANAAFHFVHIGEDGKAKTIKR